MRSSRPGLGVVPSCYQRDSRGYDLNTVIPRFGVSRIRARNCSPRLNYVVTRCERELVVSLRTGFSQVVP